MTGLGDYVIGQTPGVNNPLTHPPLHICPEFFMAPRGYFFACLLLKFAERVRRKPEGVNLANLLRSPVQRKPKTTNKQNDRNEVKGCTVEGGGAGTIFRITDGTQRTVYRVGGGGIYCQ